MTSCKLCISEHRREAEAKLRQGVSQGLVGTWLDSLGEPTSRMSVNRHATRHMGLASTTGRKPLSGDFLADVRDRVAERMAAGEIEPGIRDGIQAQGLLDTRSARMQDRDLMAKIAAALTGQLVGGPEMIVLEPDYAAAQDEFSALLGAGPLARR